MQTTAAETVVPAEPPAVYPAVLELITSVWSVSGEDVVQTQPPTRLVHSVRLDDEIACWLSWELTAADSGGTHVRLVHDELDTLPAPAPDLVTVLRMLRDSVLVRNSS